MGASEIQQIDVRQLDHEGVICAYLAGDVLVDCGPAARVETLLEGLGDARPRALALTHIHLDHAGAAGTLAARWPDLEVWVHVRGAPHLIDPTKLLASATRLYGEDMERLWGEVRAVPEANVRVLRGGESLEGFEVAYTPGHASHHVSYWHPATGTAFVGDVGGVRITPDAITIPPTPPPDIDVELWHESVATVRGWAPERLAMTHFGESTDVAAQLDEIEARLDAWAELAREGDRERFIAVVREEISRQGTAEQAAQYQQAAPAEQLYAGYERYWAKRAAAAE